jgi:hypothetical protein
MLGVTAMAAMAVYAADYVPWHAAVGRPTIAAGTTVAAYVWHDGDTVYVKVSDDVAKGQIWGGRITVTGASITNPSRINDARDERIKQVKPTELDFRFDTQNAVDGIKFTLTKDASTDAKRPGIRFDIRVDKAAVQNLYYGQDSTGGTSPMYFTFHEPATTPAP